MFSAGHPSAIADPACTRTRDHIVPAMMGVKALHPDNVKRVCRGCNEIKGSAPFEIFAYFMRNAKRQPVGQARLAMNQFVYSLARVSFVLAKQDALARAGVPQEPFEATSLETPRGRFTKRDLRRGRA